LSPSFAPRPCQTYSVYDAIVGFVIEQFHWFSAIAVFIFVDIMQDFGRQDSVIASHIIAIEPFASGFSLNAHHQFFDYSSVCFPTLATRMSPLESVKLTVIQQSPASGVGIACVFEIDGLGSSALTPSVCTA